ncbi:MAG: PQQ-dependent sugar dehydrogenase [Acidobacteria bacterium]|nr:PQQ-dependent sugar dehydrogenase [Acidobacteriota bacterium]MDA1233665.1 PQQ-dependent sugar dehydrogenase [Acidobacteriota bacterium]
MRIVILTLFLAVATYAQTPEELYVKNCAGCHGANLEGAQYTPLRKTDWRYGGDRDAMYRTVMYGVAGTEMPPWARVMTADQVHSVVDFIIARQTAPAVTKTIPTSLQSSDYSIRVETLAQSDELGSAPWGIEFVDDRRALITELRGGLRWLIDGKLDPEPIAGIPVTVQYGESGMTDVALDPNYANNGWVYISYVHALGDETTNDTPAMTRVIRGRVSDHRWVEQETVFTVPDDLHFAKGLRWGCRMMFDGEGRLYFSIGDIGRNDEVQQLSKPAGKVYRVNPDGSIPADNPYVGTPGALEAIFTIGNRNVQGIGSHPLTGDIWAVEHGPMGGDELNILEKGKNYGWPVITYGLNYDGSIVSDLTEKDGMEQPIKYWKPSPGLGPLEFYTGNLFPKWKNKLLVGAMVLEEIKLLTLGDRSVESEELIMKNHGRVRDIKVGPDGAIYALLNNPDAVIRLTPSDNQ